MSKWRKRFVKLFHYSDTEYVTFQYQPETLYCDSQNYPSLDLGQSSMTYEIPVVQQDFGDNSTNTTTFVQLQVVGIFGLQLNYLRPLFVLM